MGLAGGRHEESASESEPGARLPLEQQLQACASATANPVPVQLLRKYIAYAQTYVTPVPSAEAKEVRLLTTLFWLLCMPYTMPTALGGMFAT